jgi:DNA-binding XRE family transcriptional regulator
MHPHLLDEAVGDRRDPIRPPLVLPGHAGGVGWRRRELGALGRAVRELRARHGLSQEQLGHRCGLHRNYVGAVERGEVNTTFRVLLQLCHGLRLPFAELIAVYERQRTWS